MPQNQFSVQIENLQVLATKTADGNAAKTMATRTARASEVWFDLRAINAGTVDFLVQTSFDGTNFFTTKSVTGVSVTGMTKIVLNRADNALGVAARMRFELNGGATSIDIIINGVRME